MIFCLESDPAIKLLAGLGAHLGEVVARDHVADPHNCSLPQVFRQLHEEPISALQAFHLGIPIDHKENEGQWPNRTESLESEHALLCKQRLALRNNLLNQIHKPGQLTGLVFS